MNNNFINYILLPYIQNEFTWLLLSNNDYKIKFNNNDIKLAEHENFPEFHLLDDHEININSVIWSEKPNNERSLIYFISSENKIVHKELSNLNHKGFYASSYVKSDWFDNFNNDDNILIDNRNIQSEVFGKILRLSKDSLKQKYIEFRNKASDELIKSYEKDGIFPEYRSDNIALNNFHLMQLKETIKTIYEAKPALFSKSLNKSQKTILVKLLDKIVQTNNLSELFDVLSGVVDLSENDTKNLSTILKRTTLSNIASTIKTIKSRLDIIDLFHELVFKNNKSAYEVPHIQRCIESNLWLFGEQYNIIASEEVKFEKAIRNLLKINGNHEYYDKYSLDHPDKNKEMDIFATQRGIRCDENNNQFNQNIVIELKRPSVKLRDIELEQIKKYKNVISSDLSIFNENDKWDFILVGNEISDSTKTAATLRDELKGNKYHGEQGLVLKTENIRIYVKTWCQIISDFKIRYSTLSKNLELKELEIIESGPDDLTKSILNKKQ